MLAPAGNGDIPFYIVDFDRTTADSDKLLDVFLGVVDHYLDLPREQIEAADADVKARGDSFDTASYVRDHLASQGRDGDEKWESLTKQFIHEARALNMLLPGATELFNALEARQLRYGILTYGNPLWQHLKLTAAGCNHIPRIIMTTKEKGKLISKWQRPDGSFVLPQEFGAIAVSRIVMYDDKAVSFNDFPPFPSEGYWVVDLEHTLPSQRGTVPANVHHVTGLNEIVTIFKQDS